MTVDLIIATSDKQIFGEVKNYSNSNPICNFGYCLSLQEIADYQSANTKYLLLDIDNCSYYFDVLLNQNIKTKFKEIILFTRQESQYANAVKAVKYGATDFCQIDELIPTLKNYFSNQSEIVNSFHNNISILDENNNPVFSLEKVFNLVPSGIFFIDANTYKILDVNIRVVEYFAKAKEDMIGKSMVELNLWADNEDYMDFIHRLKEEKRLRYKEYIFNRQNGKDGTVLVSADYYEIETESLIIISGVDISDRAAAAKERKIVQSQQSELTILKGSFVSMISHEFRTPLTTIQLSTDLLRRYSDKWTEEERNKQFDRIQATMLKMTKLMENVLIIGKIESGQFVPNLENVDLASYCSAIAGNIEFNSMGTHKIKMNYEENEFVTNIDENLIGLIITNLLTNAVKYSPKGSQIDFTLKQTDIGTDFIIQDYGMGIPPDDLPNLFNSFFRAKNVGPIDGYGLGLSLVKMCVEAHKGEISVESTLGEGTTVKVSIPTSLTHDDFTFRIN